MRQEQMGLYRNWGQKPVSEHFPLEPEQNRHPPIHSEKSFQIIK